MMDFQQNFLQSLASGFKIGSQIKDRQDDNQLRQLASQSYGLPQEDRRNHLAKMAGVSPEYAAAQQKQWSADDEMDREELVRMARFIKQAPQSEQASAYGRILPALRAKGMQAPDWNEQTQGDILKTVDALASAYGPQNSTANAVQSTKIGDDGYYYTVDRSGNWTKSGVKADPNAQIIEGQGGFFNVDKRANSATPVNIGGGGPAPAPSRPGVSFTAEDGSSVPTQQFAAADGSPVAFDAGVPQHVRDQILQQPGAFAGAPDRSTANLPPANRAPQGGNQLQAPSKPKDAPAGFRYAADGTTLEFIPGGPADPFLKNEQRAAKPMPPAVLKLREETIAEAETAKTINASLDRHLGRMRGKTLSFGPLQNLIAQGRNAAGASDEQSRNFAEFKNDLERLRNDSLRLNSGVQTDGDAQRAWNELFSNLNDTQYVLQRLEYIRGLNERAETLKRASVERIDAEYGNDQSSPARATGNDGRRQSLLDKY